MLIFYKAIHYYLCLQSQGLVLNHPVEQDYTISGTDNQLYKIDIVVDVNYKSSNFFPICIPASIHKSSTKNSTSFVNANIIRPWLFS